MNRRLSALLFLFGVIGWCQWKGARTFDLDLPTGWKDAKDLVLVLQSLEVPADKGVVFRLYPGRETGGTTLGSVAVLAKSRTAKGTQQLETVKMNLTDEFRRWAEKQNGSSLSIMLVPYAGLRKAPEFDWRVKEIRLEAYQSHVP